MDNLNRLHDLLEDIGDAFLIELEFRNANTSLLDILQKDVLQDLERVLEKIKKYGNKIND
jgi:hypothetical protein